MKGILETLGITVGAGFVMFLIWFVYVLTI